MIKFTVDQSKCVKDGICAKVCPVSIINIDKQGFPFVDPAKSDRCLACGHCVAFCPTLASALSPLAMAAATKLSKVEASSFETFANLIKQRRSIRDFTDTLVSKEAVTEIIDICKYIPTAKNARKLRWVVLSGSEQIKEVNRLLIDAFDHFASLNEKTPEGVACKRLANAGRKGINVFFRGAKQLVMAIAEKHTNFEITDGAIAMTYFELAALTKGIGCCWAGYFMSGANSYKPLQEFLAMQENEIIGGAQMFGLPKIKPSFAAPRDSFEISWKE